MKTNLLKVALMTSALAATALAAHAESFTMTVPFAFSAGGKMLPAGSYSVETSAMVLTLKGSGNAMMMAIPGPLTESKTGASFDESSEVAALTGISLPSGLTYTIPISKRSAVLVASPPNGALLSKHK